MRGRVRSWLSLSRLVLCAAPMLLSLLACPFSSEHPLSDPSQAVLDSALAGDWKAADPEDNQLITVTFLAWNKRELVAFSREAGETGGKIDAYRVFVTVIDGQRFLNMQELGLQSSKEWFFASYRVSGDTLTFQFIDDTLFGSQKLDSSDALRDLVRRNLDNPALYGTDSDRASTMVFTRAEGR